MQGTSILRILAAHASLSSATARDEPESRTTSLESYRSTSTTTITMTVSFKSHVSIATQEELVPTTVTASPPASSSTAASSPTSSSSSSTMSPKSSLESIVLNSTNFYRKFHLADPLNWNSTLAEYAENHAKTCIWKHSAGPYGENLAANYKTSTLAIDAWAHEENLYDYAKKKFSHDNGHFTQLVWKNTTEVGCAVVDDCDQQEKGDVQGTYLVCEYFPAGNVKGEFGRNVQRPGIAEDGTLGFGGAEERTRGLKRSLVVLGVAYLLVCMVV